MSQDTFAESDIFLTVVCAFYLAISFIFNFTFLITLLKQRRLNRIDKSNYLLTHLILVDFLSAFFILVPSGYGVYNSGELEYAGCKVQTFFTTFFLSTHFTGLLILSIERFIRYKWPVWHINTFTERLSYDENDNLVGENFTYKTILFIVIIWLINIFIAFIPFFGNVRDVQYFDIESQCDYMYEKFTWWLWLFFWVVLTGPCLIAFGLYITTLSIIFSTQRVIQIKR